MIVVKTHLDREVFVQLQTNIGGVVETTIVGEDLTLEMKNVGWLDPEKRYRLMIEEIE